MKMMIDAATFREGAEKRFSKKSGIVALDRCCVMMRVRRPRMTQAISEPIRALPIPTRTWSLARSA